MVKNDYEDQQLPWDPLWEYVFGDEEYNEPKRWSTPWGKRKAAKKEENLFDYVFQNDEGSASSLGSVSNYFRGGDTGRGSSQRRFWPSSSSKADDTSLFGRSFDDDRNDQSGTRGPGLFSRKNDDDQDSILSFLDQPYEITEQEYLRQQSAKSRRENRGRQKYFNNRAYRSNDDESWFSGMTGNESGKNRSRKGHPWQTPGRKKRRTFPWQKRKNESSSSSLFEDPWPTLKQRAESEAAKSRGDTEDGSFSFARPRNTKNRGDEKGGVFSFGGLADVLDPYDEVDSVVSSEASSSEYSNESEYSSYASASHKSEETASIITSVTQESGSMAGASYSERTPISRRLDSTGRGSSRSRPTLLSDSRGSSMQTNEVRLKYNPSEYSATATPMTTIKENGSHAQGLSTVERKMSSDGDEERSTVETRKTGGDDMYDSFDDLERPGKTESFSRSLGKEAVSRSPLGNASMLSDEGSMRSFFLPPNKLGKIACCRPKDLGEEMEILSRESGIPFHELSKEELEQLFPKLRSISEDVSQTRNRSIVVGNSQSFEKNFPAHLQAIVAENGPQSLYEYEYEKGSHKLVVYESFGPDPRSLLKVLSTDVAPQLLKKGNDYDSMIIIQVEASTVSRTDCCIREGRWMGDGYIPLPNSPGVDVVGKIYRIHKQEEQKSGLKVGDRVMALTKYGGNARYLGIDADQVVRVPEAVDPAEAACLAETYLTAFQCLHHGQSLGQRYRKASLRTKSILIIGSMSVVMGGAISQLSALAAVDNVYAISKPSHFQRLTSIGILPLSIDHLQWFERLLGRIDILISFDEEITPILQKVVSSSGEIIIVTQTGFDPDQEPTHFDKKPKFVCARHDSQNARQVRAYNVHNEWEENLSKCKKDLEHLVELLVAARVVPQIIDRIPLNKVARAQEIMEVKNVPGFIVCEPWLVSKSRAVLL